MNYWLDVFSPQTWVAFTASGGSVTAFSKNMSGRAASVEHGDRFVCYPKGKIGWVGALEATGPAYSSAEQIWDSDAFPVRVPVRPLVMLPPNELLPMTHLEGKLSFLPGPLPPSMYAAKLQGSPRKLTSADGEAIYRALLAHEDGVLARSTRADVVVTAGAEPVRDSRHVEIQALLASWGLATGCAVWVPRSDRQRLKTVMTADAARLLDQMPMVFGGRAQSIIENIDVLWLRGNAVIASFEVENSTAIYSGILRMSDLIASVPNLNIRMYVVAPDARRAAVRAEITRPTFAALTPPLSAVCGFIGYDKLTAEFDALGSRLRNFRPEGIQDVAKYFSDH